MPNQLSGEVLGIKKSWLKPAPKLIALACVLIATLLIVHTYTVFDQTADENSHIACGMEWLDRGTYNLEVLHPPFARIATALLPYLTGARDPGIADMVDNGNAILNWNGHYESNLTLARLGVLPFFWIASFIIWRFMAMQFSHWHAAVAIFPRAFCPVVLAHSGLATTDAPLMAMFLWAAVSVWKLLQKPTWRAAAMSGLIIGLCLLTKFTAIPFLFLTGGALWILTWMNTRRNPVPMKLAGLTALILFLTIWAGYRFEVGPVRDPNIARPAQGQIPATRYSAIRNAIVSCPCVPANLYFRGIMYAWGDVTVGRDSYLLGQTYRGGRWYFFPIAILVKTPIPLLLLFFCGIVWTVSSGALGGQPATTLLILGFVGPLVVGIGSSMNIGLRHILPVYPFVAMLGSLAAVQIFRMRMRPALHLIARTIVLLLLAWNLESCLHASPDFLAYFNEVAASDPSYFLVHSDLDWGQDVKRLSHTLQQLNVDRVSLVLLGDQDLLRAHLPPFQYLKPSENPGGWIAISEYWLKECPGYSWLEPSKYIPVGRSIRVYHVPLGNIYVPSAPQSIEDCPAQ